MINQLQRYCQSNCFHSLSFFALCLSIGVRLCEPSLPLFVLTGCRVTTVTSYSICSGVQSFQYWVAQNWLTKKQYTVFLKRNLFNVEIRWTERFISMICITNSSQNYTKRAVSPYTDWCTPTEHFRENSSLWFCPCPCPCPLFCPLFLHWFFALCTLLFQFRPVALC